MEATNTFFYALFIVWLIIIRKSDCSRNSSRDDICLSSVPENYDRFSPPHEPGKPNEVFLQIEILDLDEIDEADMDFRLHAYIRTVWKDKRLLEDRVSMHEDCLKHIWNPDLTFEKAKNIIDIRQEDVFFAVRDDHIYFTKRYSFKVMCKMDFHLYPFDTQWCIFTISFSSTDDSQAVLKWFNDKNSPYRNLAQPILFSDDIEPLQFYMQTPTMHSIVRQFQFTNFTYIYTTIPLSRRLTGCLVNYYMPSALLVFISWITFWLPGDAGGERVTLIMTALLTICTQANQYKAELPPVNYITAMDIWFFVCTFMIFATLIEFAFSYNTYRKEKMQKSLIEKETISFETLGIHNFEETEKAGTHKENQGKIGGKSTSIKKHLQIDETTYLDSVSKIIFPSCFFVFFFIYWLYYLCV